MDPDSLNSSQLDLLLHAGIYGLCRVPAQDVDDVQALREAGLVTLCDDCFRLTLAGERHVARLGGLLTPRHLH
jgi:hypothetical protein